MALSLKNELLDNETVYTFESEDGRRVICAGRTGDDAFAQCATFTDEMRTYGKDKEWTMSREMLPQTVVNSLKRAGVTEPKLAPPIKKEEAFFDEHLVEQRN